MFFESINPTLKELARATVVSNQDPENKGRIRLEYPWLGKASAKLPSEWARICFPYASKDSGWWMLPEVGDEVLVYFDNGNMEFPIVLGALYGGKNTPPKSGRSGDLNSDKENNLRFLRTRSGHMLCFDDSQSKGAIVITDRDGRSLELNSSDDNIQLKDTHGHVIALKNSELSIQNKDGSKLVIKGNTITIEATGSIELGQGASEALVKGNSFMQLFNSHTHTVGPSTSTPPLQPMQATMLSKKVKTS